MKKKIIGLVSVFLVLAVSLAVYFAFGNKPIDTSTPSASSTPAPTPEPKITIIDVELEDTKYISIKNPDEDEYKLEHTQKIEGEDTVDVYKLVVPAGIDVDEEEIGTIFSLMTSLSGTQVAESVVSGAADSDFGFDKMTLVTLEMKDGTKYVLEVGDHINEKDGTFLRKQGESKVYVIGYGEGLYLKSNMDQLKNRNLFLATEDDFVNKVSMTQKGAFKFTIEGTVSKLEDDTETEDWVVTAPVKWNLTYDSSLLNFLNQFYNIQAASCIEETTDLKQYGLDNPAYGIELTVNNKVTHKLLLGNKDENGAYYYAKWNDSDNVYTLPVSQFYDLDRSVESMISNLVTSEYYYDLNKFDVEYKGVNHTFEIETGKNDSGIHDKEKDAITYKGKVFTQTAYPDVCQSFRKVYESSLGIWFEEIDSKAEPKLENPEITLKLTNKATKKTQVIQYVKKDENRLYVFVNQEYTGVLAKSSIINNPADNVLPGLANTLPAFLELFKTVK